MTAEISASQTPSGPAPAAIERVSFFDELARRRRNARLLSLSCLLVAGGIGIVVSTVVTPLLLLLAGAVLKLLASLGLFPEFSLRAIHGLAGWARGQFDNFGTFIDALGRVNRLSDLRATLAPLLALATVCIPSFVAAALIWCALRGLLIRVESDVLTTRLKARPAAAGDREEHQLGNILEELAIAAGLPAPRLLIIDSPVVNAALIGRSHRDATILVTRGVLDKLDRDATSGLVAHLVAQIGEGDVGITGSILAVYQTFAFFLTIIDLPVRWSAWRALGGLILLAAGARRSPEATARSVDLLESALDTDTAPDVDKMLGWVGSEKLRKVLVVPFLPFILLSVFMKLVLFLWTALFLNPPLALLWRNRRYSADALGVELIRNPDAIANALRLCASGEIPQGGQGREYFFVHAARTKGGFADRRTITVALHPTIERRLRRLAALGASSVSPAKRPLLNYAELRKRPLAAGLVIFLLLLLIPLFTALILMVGYITSIVMTIALAAGLMIASGVLGALG